MWETCGQKIAQMGGQVLMKHCVQAIEHKDGTIVAVRAQTPDGERRFEAEHFFSTMPVRSLVRALDPQPPQAVVDDAEGLKYRDFLVVALMLQKEDLFPDNWIYIHTPGVKVGRIQNFNNWSPEMVPEPGMTCLGLEYFCFEGDDLWTMADDRLIELGTTELDRLGLVQPGWVADGCVVRMEKAYPVYGPGYQDDVRIIREWLATLGNLQVAGRNGMHKYNNQDHSMMTALLAARNILGGNFNVWNVNTDAEYHEEGDVPENDTSGRQVPRRVGE